MTWSQVLCTVCGLLALAGVRVLDKWSPSAQVWLGRHRGDEPRHDTEHLGAP